MKRIAQVRNGVVWNIALWDGVSAWAPPDLLVDVTAKPEVDIGFLYDGVAFTAPPTPTEGV